jgi:hypothetical protein
MREANLSGKFVFHLLARFSPPPRIFLAAATGTAAAARSERPRRKGAEQAGAGARRDAVARAPMPFGDANRHRPGDPCAEPGGGRERGV